MWEYSLEPLDWGNLLLLACVRLYNLGLNKIQRNSWSSKQLDIACDNHNVSIYTVHKGGTDVFL
jgi:hypothetical protein